MTDNAALALGIAGGLALLPILGYLFRMTTVRVEDEHAVLLTSFGKLVATFTKAGLHAYPARILPWVRVHKASLAHEFRHLADIRVNDIDGTTVKVDLWVEFRIVDPAKALFAVADWDRALQGLLVHATTSILGNRTFREILCDRKELSALLAKDVADDVARWGIQVEISFIRKVDLLPEVSRQLFQTVAARLERAQADIDERGRLAVAKLEADTSVQIAGLVAHAKGKYPEAVGRALSKLAMRPQVLAAYTELYELSLVRPHRTIAFAGFATLRAEEAAMLAPPLTDGAPLVNGALAGLDAARLPPR